MSPIFDSIHGSIDELNQLAVADALDADDLAKLQPLAKWARQNPMKTPDPGSEQEPIEEPEKEEEEE